jgi:uncharacterized membrane protein required for colicin V production
MDVLQRLQPLDVLFAIVWACVVGWGLQSGFVRQLGMLVGVYAAAVVAGSLYRPAGNAFAYAFGDAVRPTLELVSYVALFVLVFGLIAVFIWQAYPLSRLRGEFGFDNLLGAAVAAVWGVLLLIGVLTILRFYAVTPLQAQGSQTPQPSQLDIQRQVQLSQIAPVLEVVASPLWEAMTPWFPARVSPRV